MLLIKLDSTAVDVPVLESITSEFKGHVIDESENTITIELINTGEILDLFIERLEKDWIIEVVRSGVSGIALGASAIKY